MKKTDSHAPVDFFMPIPGLLIVFYNKKISSIFFGGIRDHFRALRVRFYSGKEAF